MAKPNETKVAVLRRSLHIYHYLKPNGAWGMKWEWITNDPK